MKLKAVLHAVLATAFAATLNVAHASNAAGASFEVARHYALPGAEHWDYVAYDPVRKRLFISRDTHVQVIDANTGKLVGEIAGTDGVHGFAFVQKRKLGFVTNGRANTITVVNLDTLKVLDTIAAAGPDPDGILYVPALQRVFVSNGHDRSVSAIDVATRKIVATMPVGGKPEALAADGRGHVFVNIEDRGEIVEMDGKAGTVLAHWPLPDCKSPTGLAIDAARERLFPVCANLHMMVVDADSGRIVTTLPIGGRPDSAAFDPALRLVFSSNGAHGTLTVVHEDGADRFHVVQNVSTLDGARTMALDAKDHRVYLVSSKFAPADPGSASDPHAAKVVPGTFEVLVVGRR